MAFEHQRGLKTRVIQNDMRASVYKSWGAALSAIGQSPPF